MDLSNEFTVALPVERAWEVLTDVERIAPCMPGAQLQEIEGDEYRGIVKVKVGPITAQYKGKATFIERDDAAHRAVLRAEGRETAGKGNANATITAALTPDGDGTHVLVTTELTVTGKVAQFGRGVLADVSARLLTQFVECLETTVLGGGNGAEAPAATEEPPATVEAPAPPAGGPASGAAPGGAAAETAVAAPSAEAAAAVRKVDQPEAKPVDLGAVAGVPVAKRVAPALVALALLWLLRQLIRRRRRV